MAKPFIDSNVVLYLFSSDAVKADRAESLLQSGGLISVQVLNEVASVCLRKLKMTWEDIDAVLETLKSTCEVLPVTLASNEKAIGLAQRYQLSLYDANIVANAILGRAKNAAVRGYAKWYVDGRGDCCESVLSGFTKKSVCLFTCPRPCARLPSKQGVAESQSSLTTKLFSLALVVSSALRPGLVTCALLCRQ